MQKGPKKSPTTATGATSKSTRPAPKGTSSSAYVYSSSRPATAPPLSKKTSASSVQKVDSESTQERKASLTGPRLVQRNLKLGATSAASDNKPTPTQERQPKPTKVATANSRSKFATNLCTDVYAEIFGFLMANDQAKMRRMSKHFCTVFNHAFQRGYVAAAICERYVETVTVMHEDGKDGNPLLRVAPVDPLALFCVDHQKLFKRMKRSEAYEVVTLFVNMRLLLGSGKTVLKEKFLRKAPFYAVHIYGTETLKKIEHDFARGAKMSRFTMTTPCPKLTEIGGTWLYDCRDLFEFDISGCFALERIGTGWLTFCDRLSSVNFTGCRRLTHVGNLWLGGCWGIESADFSALVALETVGDGWLRGCIRLEKLDFSPCRNLRSVKERWMERCDKLWQINLCGCLELKEVGDGFLNGSESLEHILVLKDQKLPPNVLRKASLFVGEGGNGKKGKKKNVP